MTTDRRQYAAERFQAVAQRLVEQAEAMKRKADRIVAGELDSTAARLQMANVRHCFSHLNDQLTLLGRIEESEREAACM